MARGIATLLLVNGILSQPTNYDALDAYLLHRQKLPGWRFILASDRGSLPGAALNRSFGKGGVVRSPFPSERVLLLDSETVEDMLRRPQAEIPIDYSISLDTMAFSYIRRFLEGQTTGFPIDFPEALLFLAQPTVNCDPMPYMFENIHQLRRGAHLEQIFQSIKAYEVLRSIDIEHLQKHGTIRSWLSEQQLIKAAQEFVADALTRSGYDPYFDSVVLKHRQYYCLLLKMAEVQFSSRARSLGYKILRFFDFMANDMAAVAMPESALARRFFQDGQKVRFFGGVQQRKVDLLKVLRNMAWDLFHIRHLEFSLSLRPDHGGRYNFSALLTFDARLLEVLDVYSLRGCAIGPNKEIQPFYEFNSFEAASAGLTESERQRLAVFFTEEAAMKRAASRDLSGCRLSNLEAHLEERLAKVAGIDLEHARQKALE